MVTALLRLFAALVILGIVTLGTGCAHMTVSVRNDTQEYLRVADCVDDSVDVAPGDTFTAEGRSKNDKLVCWITRSNGSHRCVTVPRLEGTQRAFPLSRATEVPASKC